MAAKIGIAPLSMPARLEEMCCCAIGNSVIGKASHVMLTATMRGHAVRGIAVLEDGTRPSAMQPKQMRAKVTRPGANASRHFAMNRNDAPQISPVPASSAQSLPVKASRWVPSAVRVDVDTAEESGSERTAQRADFGRDETPSGQRRRNRAAIGAVKPGSNGEEMSPSALISVTSSYVVEAGSDRRCRIAVRDFGSITQNSAIPMRS